MTGLPSPRAVRDRVRLNLVRLAALLVALHPGVGFAQSPVDTSEPRRFVILQDGESPLLDAAAVAIVEEARAMFPGVAVERARADFSAEVAGARVAEAYARSDLRGLVVVGPRATQAAVAHGGGAPTVSVLGAPLSAHGVPDDDPRAIVGAGSGLYFVGDLSVLRGLAPEVRTVHVLVTAEAARALPALDAHLRAVSEAQGMAVQALELSPGAALPDAWVAGKDALYLGLSLSPEEIDVDALLARAAARGVAVVSGLSPDVVEAGALMSVIPEDAAQLRARQAVLAMHALLEGEAPASLRVEMASAPARATASDWALPFKLNLDVAQALGLEPTFAQLQSADVVEAGEVTRISFERAVARALEANRSLEAAGFRLEGGAARVRKARGALMPRLEANATGTWIDDDRAAGPFPPAERVVAVGGTASQAIYSPDRIGANAVEKRLQQARSHDFDATRLDLTLDVAVRYVELMRARVLVGIAEQRVRSSRANLALAEGRHQAGDVGRDEIYRWRVDLAESQQSLVREKASLAKAVANLNEVQAYQAQRPVRPDEPDGSALPMLATDPRLTAYFERPSGLRSLQMVAFDRAFAAAPELAAARARVEAADRNEAQQRRTMLAPDLDLVASLTGRVWNDGRGSDVPPIPGLVVPDNLDWSVGVVATLPLFEGLSQKSAVDEARADKRRLQAEQEALALQLSRRVYNALQEASAAHQNTTLATEAAEASRANLELVRDAYSRGAVDVIRLVDAQTQAYANEATARNAYHDFLIAFVAVERLLGQFSFGPSAMNTDDFFREVERRQVAGKPPPQASVEP